MASKKSDALVKADTQALAGFSATAGLQHFDNPSEAFAGFEGEMFPEVFNFKNAGECLDITVIGKSAPVQVKDDFEDEVDRDTWEVAIQPNYRLRLMTSAQLDQMMPSLIGKKIRLVYSDMLEHGKRRVKQYRAAIFSDQSNAVPLTDAQKDAAETLRAELALASQAKKDAARARQPGKKG